MNKPAFLSALLLALLATLRVRRDLLEVPRFGKLFGDFFQPLGKNGALVSNAWNF